MMPLYQFWCDACYQPHEVTMKIEELGKLDSGRVRPIPCPECSGPLRKLIAPPKLIRIR